MDEPKEKEKKPSELEEWLAGIHHAFRGDILFCLIKLDNKNHKVSLVAAAPEKGDLEMVLPEKNPISF